MLKRFFSVLIQVSFLFSVISIACYCSEGENEQDLTGILMEVSGQNRAIEMLPMLINYEVTKGFKGKQMPFDDKEFLQLIEETTDISGIKDFCHDSLHDKLSADEKRELIKWYESDIGKKIVNQELKAITVEELKKKDEFELDIRNLQVSPERSALLIRYENILNLEKQTAEFADTVNKEIPGSNISESKIRDVSNSRYIRILYTFRETSDEDLERYVNFLDSKLGKKYYGLTSEFEKQTTLELMKKLTGAAFKNMIEESDQHIYKDLNFRLDGPQKPWVKLDPEKINPDATLCFYRTNPGMTFSVIAEKIEGSMVLENEAILEISKANFISKFNKVKFFNEKKYKVNGLKGIRYCAESTTGSKKIYAVNWIYSGNGYIFQLIFTGPETEKKAVNQTFGKLVKGFHLIDKDKTVYTTPINYVRDFSSPDFQYGISIKEKGWVKWEDLKEDIPEADFGCHKNTAVFFVTPIYYGKDKPRPEAILKAFMGFMNIQETDKDVTSLVYSKKHGNEVYTFDFKADFEDGDLIYSFKIIIKPEFCYFAGMWAPALKKDFKKISENLFNSLKFYRDKKGGFDLSKLDNNGKRSHAEFYNSAGLYYYEMKNYDAALKYFKMAVGLEEKSSVFLFNALNSYSAVNKYSEALSFLLSRISAHAENLDVKSWEGWLLNKTGEKDKSLIIYREIFSKGYRGDDDFILFMSTLAESEKWEEIEKYFSGYLKEEVSLPVYIEQARIKRISGKYEEAVSMLKEQQKKIPFNGNIAIELIHNYHLMGYHKDIIAITDELIKNEFYPAAAYYYKGEAEYYLKWYRKAKKSLEKSLEYAPEDRETKDFILHVSGLLGEGNNTDIKKEIPQVELPEELNPCDINDLKEINCGDYSAFYINKIKGISYEKGDSQRTTTYEKIKILDESGVIKFSTLEIDFNPLYDDIYVNKIVINNEKGEFVSQVDPSSFYIIDQQGSSLATHNKTLHIPVLQLKPGYIIDLVYTVKTYSDSFIYFESSFSKDRPVLYSAVFFRGDVSEIKHITTGDPEMIKIKKGIAWFIKKPPAFKWEPLQIHYEHFLPMIWIGSSRCNWQEIGKSYLENIKDKFILTETVKAYAGELTDRLADQKDKIEAIISDIQKSYIYKAIEFGSRGNIPNSGDDIIKNRYGDCKDHSLLLHLLLKAISVESNLVLVNSNGSDIKMDLPDMDQFNHMIVYLPGVDGGIFIDPTDKRINALENIPTNLGSYQALILDPDNITFRKIPEYKFESNSLDIKRELDVKDNNDLELFETVVIRGNFAGFMRENLIRRDKINYRQWIQGLYSSYINSVTVQSFEVKNLLENREDLVFTIKSTVSDKCRKENTNLVLKVPNFWEEYYFENESAENRMSDFRIVYPFSVRSCLTIAVPTGFAITPVNDMNLKSAFGHSESGGSEKLSGCSFLFSCLTSGGRFDKSRYPEYVDFFNRVIGQSGPEITLLKK